MADSHVQRFFEFIRYALNANPTSIPDTKDIDWQGLYVFSQEQAIVGIVFKGIKNLGNNGIQLPLNVLSQWIVVSEQIAGQNKLLNNRCVEVLNELWEAGFDCCFLKGQGNSSYYPDPYSRTPGDIDVWIRHYGNKTISEERRDGLRFLKAGHKVMEEPRCYHFGYVDNGVSVELHVMPSIMNNPIYNARLQKWYRNVAEGTRMMAEVELPDGVGKIPVPTNEFNIVFQMAHMMHHFFDEGIGLRQMMDYYYLLRNVKDDVRCKTEDIRGTLRYLNLHKFAGAVMYIMREVFGLDNHYLIVPVDERRGKTLMYEILNGGNFGQHSGLTDHTKVGKYFAKTWRNMQLVCDYPEEALCEPFFRTWHFFWRKCHLWEFA